MDERAKILEMLENGKITPEQAERLLQAVGTASKQSGKTTYSDTASVRIKKIDPALQKNLKGKLRIEVDSDDGDKVRIAVPLKLAHLALSMMPKDAALQIEREGIDISSLLAGLSESIDEIDEDLVNVTSSDGAHVRIFIDR